MTDAESLRRQLTAIKVKTASAETMDAGGWWVGDTAGERKVQDDLKAGRIVWRAAHGSAKFGLEALDADDLDMAEACLTNALWLYIEALEKEASRVRLKERALQTRSAGRRGRPKGSQNKKGLLQPK